MTICDVLGRGEGPGRDIRRTGVAGGRDTSERFGR